MFAPDLPVHRSIHLRATRQSGVSLIELVIFIVIISTGVVGLLSIMNLTSAGSADPMIRKQALAAAESMMEEVLLKDFSNPIGGFTSAATTWQGKQADRQNFDDVSDYNGFSTVGIFSVSSAAALPGLAQYNVSVSVADAALGSITAASGNAKRITVTVTGPADNTVVLDGYRTNYAP